MSAVYLLAVLFFGFCAACALWPTQFQKILGRISYWPGVIVNEQPFTTMYVLVAVNILVFTQQTPYSVLTWITFFVAIVVFLELVLIINRTLGAAAFLERALEDALGKVYALSDTLPLFRIFVLPFYGSRQDVIRVRDIPYDTAGPQTTLDIYHARTPQEGAPVLIHFHGGGFQGGSKSRETRVLLTQLASHGWVCISANYHLARHGDFPQNVIDVKKVISWIKENAERYNVDATSIYLVGDSAGATIATIAGLSANKPLFQPTFEAVDARVKGIICLYGYYDEIYGKPGSSPGDYISANAPPFLIVHGSNDTLVPIASARRFARSLARRSKKPVVFAELPDTQHSFDIFHSLRSDMVANAAEAFLNWVQEQDDIR